MFAADPRSTSVDLDRARERNVLQASSVLRSDCV